MNGFAAFTMQMKPTLIRLHGPMSFQQAIQFASPYWQVWKDVICFVLTDEIFSGTSTGSANRMEESCSRWEVIIAQDKTYQEEAKEVKTGYTSEWRGIWEVAASVHGWRFRVGRVCWRRSQCVGQRADRLCQCLSKLLVQVVINLFRATRTIQRSDANAWTTMKRHTVHMYFRLSALKEIWVSIFTRADC